MGFVANIRRDVRFARGLFRLLKRIKPIELDSDILLCDDLDRELGSLKKAQATKALAEKNGWLSVSMRDEFKTIYGDEVKRQQ